MRRVAEGGKDMDGPSKYRSSSRLTHNYTTLVDSVLGINVCQNQWLEQTGATACTDLSKSYHLACLLRSGPAESYHHRVRARYWILSPDCLGTRLGSSWCRRSTIDRQSCSTRIPTLNLEVSAARKSWFFVAISSGRLAELLMLGFLSRPAKSEEITRLGCLIPDVQLV